MKADNAASRSGRGNCSHCNGTGEWTGGPAPCSFCDGTGNGDVEFGRLILDAGTILDAAERAQQALIEIAAIFALPVDADTKLERIRFRVAAGLNNEDGEAE